VSIAKGASAVKEARMRILGLKKNMIHYKAYGMALKSLSLSLCSPWINSF
jgi:hypothetical protein